MAFHSYLAKLFFAVVLATAASGRAETLEQMIAESLRNNPELRVLERSIASANGGVTTARTLANPELSLAPGLRRTREGGDRTTEFHGEISLSQLFKFPGKRALEIAIAQRNVELAQLAREAFQFQLSARVRRAYFEMIAGQQIVAARSDQAGSARSFVESARKRVEAGYGSDFESVKSQAEQIAANKALLEAEGRVNAARVDLNALMGRRPDASLAVSGSLQNVQPRGSRTDFIALALARNPAIRTQERLAELAGLQLRSTRVGRHPDIAVGPSVEYVRDEQTFGLDATLALPLWDRKAGEIATATAEQQKALAEIEKTRAEVLAEVTKASAALESAKKQLALYSPEFLDSLKSFTAQAEQGYAQNTTTLLIYLDAKRTYFDTRADYYEALANVAHHRAALESAVGVPLDLTP